MIDVQLVDTRPLWRVTCPMGRALMAHVWCDESFLPEAYDEVAELAKLHGINLVKPAVDDHPQEETVRLLGAGKARWYQSEEGWQLVEYDGHTYEVRSDVFCKHCEGLGCTLCKFTGHVGGKPIEFPSSGEDPRPALDGRADYQPKARGGQTT